MRSFFLARYRNYKKHLANLTLAAAAAAAGLTVGSAQATSITIPNSGFETHPGSPNFGGIGGAPPWTGTAGANWASNGYGAQAHSGTGWAWVDFGSTATQTLTLGGSGADYIWAEGTYTLDAFLGDNFNGVHTNLNVLAELRNGTTDASLGSVSSTASTLNGWIAMNTLTVVIGAGNPNIGAPIKIVFTGTGDTTVNQHRGLDDIALDFEAAVVPEPGSVVTLCIGTAALGLIARRRRASDR
jgi:hypothetical protein